MRVSSILVSTAVTAVLVSSGESLASTIIYDSSSMYEWGTAHPVSGGTVAHYTQAYAAWQVVEAGGKIGFAGSAREAASATVQMRTGPNGSPAVAGDFVMTLNFYAVNSDGTVGANIGARTQTFSAPAGSGTTPITQRPYFDCTFDLSGLGLVLPDEVYFGVAFDYNQNVTTQSLNISLWNYGANPGGFNPADWFGDPTVAFLDGPQVKVGTDLLTGIWGRTSDGNTYGGSPWYHGLTPNMTIAAVPAPGAFALLGLAGLTGKRRRR